MTDKKSDSRQSGGLFGLDPHTEHFDNSGNKTGESRQSGGLFGLDPHTEHFDDSGNKTGESRQSRGLFGLDPHTEHIDTSHNSKSKSKSKNSDYSAYNSTSSNTESSLGSVLLMYLRFVMLFFFYLLPAIVTIAVAADLEGNRRSEQLVISVIPIFNTDDMGDKCEVKSDVCSISTTIFFAGIFIHFLCTIVRSLLQR